VMKKMRELRPDRVSAQHWTERIRVWICTLALELLVYFSSWQVPKLLWACLDLFIKYG
jgi:hypothetical protein